MTGQPSDADLARWATALAEGSPASPWIRERIALLLAAVRDRDARIAAARSEHWITRDMWGGEMRDVCGRCRHGDGVPMLWPCPTIAALDGPQ